MVLNQAYCVILIQAHSQKEIIKHLLHLNHLQRIVFQMLIRGLDGGR